MFTFAREAVYQQTRSGFIEAARIEKDANLTPEAQPNGERIIDGPKEACPTGS